MNIQYLINKYSKLIYKICLDMLSSPEDAEDASQDTYLKMFKSMKKYENLSENELKNILCKIALNRCKDILKSKKYLINKPSSSCDIEILNSYIEPDKIETKIIEDQQRQDLRRYIEKLPDNYKRVLEYYYLEEMKLDDISNLLNIPKSTLKVQIYRGKKMLKENIIKDRGGGYFE